MSIVTPGEIVIFDGVQARKIQPPSYSKIEKVIRCLGKWLRLPALSMFHEKHNDYKDIGIVLSVSEDEREVMVIR
jgi:hypothetical protein